MAKASSGRREPRHLKGTKERPVASDDSESDHSNSLTQSDQELSSSGEGPSRASRPALTSMGDIMGKLLRTSAPVEPILSKRRAVERRLEEEVLERRARTLVRQEAREARDAAHTIPSLDNKERELRKVATRGVVQLFNAVHQHQLAQERRRREEQEAKGEKDTSKNKNKAVASDTSMKAVSRASFLELLKMGGGHGRPHQSVAASSVPGQQ